MTNDLMYKHPFTKMLEEIYGSENVFLMGSRFFGYDHEDSDWDYLILADKFPTPTKDARKALDFLPMEVAFEGYDNLLEGRKRYESVHYSIGTRIDIIMLYSPNVFQQLVKEHTTILEYLRTSGGLEVIRNLKIHYYKNNLEMDGKDIYQFLRSTVLSKQKTEET
jgi:predicted nucleotidyltransferase